MYENEFPQSLREKYHLRHQLEHSKPEIFCIQDRSTEKLWLLKVFEKRRYKENYIQTFLNICYMVQRIKNPYLQQIEDIIENDRYLFVVLEYIQGETLTDLVTNEGWQDAETVIRLGKLVCKMLRELRQYTLPVIYTELDPDKIIYVGGSRIRLCNYEKLLYDYEYKITGISSFCAPEEVVYKGIKDERTDIFHIGMLLLYLALGIDLRKPPHCFIRIHSLIQGIPSSYPHKMKKLICKCICTDPADRYQNYEKLHRALKRTEVQIRLNKLLAL